MVRMRGLEPPRCHHHRLLRPARLPVPPHPRTENRLYEDDPRESRRYSDADSNSFRSGLPPAQSGSSATLNGRYGLPRPRPRARKTSWLRKTRSDGLTSSLRMNRSRPKSELPRLSRNLMSSSRNLRTRSRRPRFTKTRFLRPILLTLGPRPSKRPSPASCQLTKMLHFQSRL